MTPLKSTATLILLGSLAQAVPAQPAGTSAASYGGAPTAALSWDTAFRDESGGTPTHFVANFTDARGQGHRLEEWRLGDRHLRRLTDGRLDLHADAVSVPRLGQPAEYVWQIVDRDRQVLHRVSSGGMVRLGMLYSYYSMAHVLSRPAGEFQVHAADGTPSHGRYGLPCAWYTVAATGQPQTRACWSANAALPMEIQRRQGSAWRTTFSLKSIEFRPIPSSAFNADTRGLQVRDLDNEPED